MPIYISDDLLTSTAGQPIDSINPNSPRIGIQNISSRSNILASPGEFATNPSWLTSTPSTAERWKQADALSHSWECNTAGAPINYVGVAAFRGLVGASVEISYIPKEGGASVTVYGPVIITKADPILALFGSVEAASVTINFQSINIFSFELGIVNVGNTVALPRNIYVDHTPVTLGRNTQKLVANSDNGQFLGQISTKTTLKSAVSMANVPPRYYRDVLFPGFVVPAETLPFFWAWRPQSYPLEVGLCWTNGDVMASNSMANGYMQMDFEMTGYSNG